VVPAAVVFTDKDGTAEDTYTVPATEGVEYLVGDKVVEAGTYPGAGEVTGDGAGKDRLRLQGGCGYGVVGDVQGDPVEVVPAVVFTDKDGTAQDTYTVPAD
jgi:serine protease